ncbi:MAG TPA: YdeI/OmpD-associated family protein [Steroidobacteraceae bacterium]|nr:YdeI/OmpD-associated family protein [Steroidobacteraceae bacterium]
MIEKDVRLDAYIARSAPFAQPILKYLRSAVHEACPDVEETIKWGMPFFMYKGLLCNMSAFKEHCAFGFYHGEHIVVGAGRSDRAMGQFGRITHVTDLPSRRELLAYVRKAMGLKDAEVKPVRRSGPQRKAALVVPDDFAAALRETSRAQAGFETLSPSHRREYLQWIGEAKRAETRSRRIATAVAYLREGKPLNWQYMKPRGSARAPGTRAGSVAQGTR